MNFIHSKNVAPIFLPKSNLLFHLENDTIKFLEDFYRTTEKVRTVTKNISLHSGLNGITNTCCGSNDAFATSSFSLIVHNYVLRNLRENKTPLYNETMIGVDLCWLMRNGKMAKLEKDFKTALLCFLRMVSRADELLYRKNEKLWMELKDLIGTGYGYNQEEEKDGASTEGNGLEFKDESIDSLKRKMNDHSDEFIEKRWILETYWEERNRAKVLVLKELLKKFQKESDQEKKKALLDEIKEIRKDLTENMKLKKAINAHDESWQLQEELKEVLNKICNVEVSLEKLIVLIDNFRSIGKVEATPKVLADSSGKISGQKRSIQSIEDSDNSMPAAKVRKTDNEAKKPSGE